MARRTRSGFVTRRGRAVRETRWLDIDPVVTVLASANAAAISHTLNAVELALRPFTVVRTRGVWNVQSDQEAANEFWTGSLGMAVVSEQAAAIGVTAVPTPETDRQSDLWFVYETGMGQFLFDDATGSQEFSLAKDYDSKAMRKVEDGQDIVIVVENSGLGTGVSIAVSGRMLIKLH